MTSNDTASSPSELDVRAGWIAPATARGDVDDWYRGETMNAMPDKATLAREGLASIIRGWTPDAPIIDRDTRVIGVGSCFASYFVLWLAENGFNDRIEESPHNALLRYRAAFESPAVIAQQFRWAFGELDASRLQWVGKDRELFEPSEDRRLLVRRTLERTDVLILTLGLSEVWYDQLTGEPLWRALTQRLYDPMRHVFRVETLASTRAALETIEAIRSRHLPSMKIVYTVSPVPLKSTFRPVSAITANSVSKSVLRVAVDEFLRDRTDLLNRSVFYFPSYEIVREFFRDAFQQDNRHVTPYVAAQVVRCFAEHYCVRDSRGQQRSAPEGVSHHERFLSIAARDVAAGVDDEAADRIAHLEQRVEELQRVCDERDEVIGELAGAAAERLALVEQLHDECERLRRGAATRQPAER